MAARRGPATDLNRQAADAEADPTTLRRSANFLCGGSRANSGGPYFRAVATDVNVVLRLLPRLWTTAMIATEIPAAINP